ncbi:MAG: hypothetical protein EBZ31_04405 [Flavobacteriia bacterium]|nr:hypothetical protein [Flavobacteriia bacterium]
MHQLKQEQAIQRSKRMIGYKNRRSLAGNSIQIRCEIPKLNPSALDQRMDKIQSLSIAVLRIDPIQSVPP